MYEQSRHPTVECEVVAPRRHRARQSARSLAYARPYETGETMFGVDVPADFLLSRVRSFSWEASFCKLSKVAAVVAKCGANSEKVRRLTVDPLSQLTGNDTAAAIIANAKRAVTERRQTLLVAHEQAISFLQHLVLLEGGDGDEVPGDPELSLWLAGIGSHLEQWKDDHGQYTTEEDLIASMCHGLRFNNEPDAARLLVRAANLFRKPDRNELAEPSLWKKLEIQAFSGPFQEFFESVLGPLFLLSKSWGDGDQGERNPVISLDRFFRETKVDEIKFPIFLDRVSADRETLRTEIRKDLRPDGLPHAPTALLYRPFVRTAPGIYVAASPWAVQLQLKTGIWALFLAGMKQVSPKGSPDLWFRAFGGLLEDWCRLLASQAGKSHLCKVTFQMPESPGGVDEVEDVVAMEGGSAVLFSVKGRVMEAKAARLAVSVGTTLDWYDKFFFEEKGDDYRGGAIRLLDRRIERIRAGEFEPQGVARNVKILPVVVTYDSLGETDLFYKRLERKCAELGLMQGPNIGPVTLARVEEFEDLMERAADGQSLVKLLRKREHGGRHRRLDQIIRENGPTKRRRLPFFDEQYKSIVAAIVKRLSGKDLPPGVLS